MKKQSQLAGLVGGSIGFLMALLLSGLPYKYQLPGLEFLYMAAAAIAKPITEIVIGFVCGQSPNIGCSSGIGLLSFMLLWMLVFCLICSGIAVVIAILGLKLYQWWKCRTT